MKWRCHPRRRFVAVHPSCGVFIGHGEHYQALWSKRNKNGNTEACVFHSKKSAVEFFRSYFPHFLAEIKLVKVYIKREEWPFVPLLDVPDG